MAWSPKNLIILKLFKCFCLFVDSLETIKRAALRREYGARRAIGAERGRTVTAMIARVCVASWGRVGRSEKKGIFYRLY